MFVPTVTSSQEFNSIQMHLESKNGLSFFSLRNYILNVNTYLKTMRQSQRGGGGQLSVNFCSKYCFVDEIFLAAIDHMV